MVVAVDRRARGLVLGDVAGVAARDLRAILPNLALTFPHIETMSSPSHPEPAEIQRLYDENRFLDAWRQTRDLWPQRDLVDGLAPRELILAGRLANRLGGSLLARWFFRRALHISPEDPEAQFYGRYAALVRYDPFEELRLIERRPQLEDHPVLDAVWSASDALVWASFRDYDRARTLIAAARERDREHAWVACCEAEVFLSEDRFEEGLAAAEVAWQLAPGGAFSTAVLARSLASCDRLEEAASRLAETAASSQSYEVLLHANWYAMAMAERQTSRDEGRWIELATSLASRLTETAPLADRATRSDIARARLDVALLKCDLDGIGAFAAETRSRFARGVLKRMQEARVSERVLHPHRRILQRGPTCLPAAIAAVVSCFGLDFDHSELADDLTYDGTPTAEAGRWLQERGWEVRHFLLDPQLAVEMVQAGLPYVLSLQEEATAHAMAVVGFDSAAGTLLVHDPSLIRMRQMYAQSLTSDEAPIGPLGLAVVPADRATLLEIIPSHSLTLGTAVQRYFDVNRRQGAREAGLTLDDLRPEHADHPIFRYLMALQAGASLRSADAMVALQDLLATHPQCLAIRRSLIQACHGLGNTRILREALADLVERGALPGVQATQEWRYPPTTYVCQYADLLRLNADSRPRAQELLLEALRVDSRNGEAYHILSDLHLSADRVQERVLPTRLAALLERQNEHYARAHCDALRRTGREDEGLGHLASRAATLGRQVSGGVAWLIYIDTLEDYGLPERAISEMEQAERVHASDPEVAAFAVPFWARMGRLEVAATAIERLAAMGRRPLHLSVAVAHEYELGEWEKALDLSEQWVQEEPQSIVARRYNLTLLARRDGFHASLARARQWLEEAGGHHNDYEDLVHEQLANVHAKDEREELYRHRLERDPNDAWTWRELGHCLVDRVSLEVPEARAAGLEDIARVRSECDRLCPDHSATLALAARVEALAGQYQAAVTSYLRAIDADPSYSYAYSQAWELCASGDRAYQTEIRAELERRLTRAVGHLFLASELAQLIAGRFGVAEAEAAIDRWQERAPNDPELVCARARLLLRFGQGRTDAERAVLLLEPALDRFPSHRGLWALEVRALDSLGRVDDAVAALRRFLDRVPNSASARRELAELLRHSGEFEGGRELLEKSVQMDPVDAVRHAHLASYLHEQGDIAGALATLEAAVRRIPEDVGLRERLIDDLLEYGEFERATVVARDGAELLDGAYMWYLLGNCLERAPGGVDAAAVEEAYRKALEGNHLLFCAADALAVLLTANVRYDEANELMARFCTIPAEGVCARGRMAWIARVRGQSAASLDMIAAVLADNPSYSWGWARLCDWLQADQDWKRARKLLEVAPEVMLDDVEFQARRLEILGEAGGARWRARWGVESAPGGLSGQPAALPDPVRYPVGGRGARYGRDRPRGHHTARADESLPDRAPCRRARLARAGEGSAGPHAHHLDQRPRRGRVAGRDCLGHDAQARLGCSRREAGCRASSRRRSHPAVPPLPPRASPHEDSSRACVASTVRSDRHPPEPRSAGARALATPHR